MSKITLTRLAELRIGDRLISHGGRAYRTPLRMAVRSLQCQGAPRDTLYVMQVSFRNQESTGDMNERIAMIEMAPPAAGSVAVAAS